MVRRYRPYVDDPVLRPEDSALYARSWYFGSDARPGRVQGIRERLANSPRLAARGDGPGRNPGFPHDKRRSGERRVGKECVSMARSRWSRKSEKKKISL